jgi:hypothetical protein
MNQHLADLVARKRNEAQPPQQQIDWDERRKTYLAAVEALYTQIRQILAEPIAQGTIVAQTRPKQLTENFLGTYTIDDLLLLVGNEQVLFSPVGRNISGTTGRVDVVGDRAEATLIVQPGPRWSFVQSRQPTVRTVPFDESSLAEVLTIIMRD